MCICALRFAQNTPPAIQTAFLYNLHKSKSQPLYNLHKSNKKAKNFKKSCLQFNFNLLVLIQRKANNTFRKGNENKRTKEKVKKVKSMLNIIKVEVENRIAKNETKVVKKSYFTDFNDNMGCRKVYEIEYRYNKYGFLTNKVLTAYNYKPLANTEYVMWDNTSIINIHIGYYTKQVTRGIDCFMR